jgi:hypothetical protein
MTHPILEPLVVQLPDKATSRKLIESGGDYVSISNQLARESKWCGHPNTVDGESSTGILNLQQNGYQEWLKDAEEEDFVRMVGVLQLLYDTCLALKEDQEEED